MTVSLPGETKGSVGENRYLSRQGLLVYFLLVAEGVGQRTRRAFLHHIDDPDGNDALIGLVGESPDVRSAGSTKASGTQIERLSRTVIPVLPQFGRTFTVAVG
ncbi:MAG: hypothetical protein ACKVHU_19615 [Acidimicrobiales bacterium]